VNGFRAIVRSFSKEPYKKFTAQEVTMVEQDEWVESLAKEIKEETIKCWNCNFCYSTCPLYKSMRGFMINGPSGLTQSIYYGLHWGLLGKELRESITSILYSCTTCNSCTLTCKDISAGIPVLDIILRGRKLLLEMGLGPSKTHKDVLESLNNHGNPYGKPASKRLDWLKDLEKEEKLTYKIIPNVHQADVLLFVGCTASYDEDLQKVARAVVLLFEKAKVNYGILREEKCCGNPARQIGDEGLFGDLSEAVMRAILESNVGRIVTISPHCYYSFKAEYPESFRKLKIQHYTQFFSDIIQNGMLSPKRKIERTLTFQDPCYLGKRSEIYDAPRKIISGIPGIKLVEMKHNKRDSLCCGGGGGRMWIEVDEVQRMSHLRLQEALSAKADMIATACPWCYTQMKDAIKATDNENTIEFNDVSQILLTVVY
jgi:Fe-S oxidoreductase